MDYSKKGPLPTLKPDAQVARQLATGIGQCVDEMLDNGAARQARVKAPVPRVAPGNAAMGDPDPREIGMGEQELE